MKLINKDLLSLEKGIPAGMQNVLNRQKKIMRVGRGYGYIIMAEGSRAVFRQYRLFRPLISIISTISSS